MPKSTGKGEELRQVERKVDRAKDNLLVLQYDIPRARLALDRATAAQKKAGNTLQRLIRRRDQCETKVEQYEAKAESLKEILGIDD